MIARLFSIVSMAAVIMLTDLSCISDNDSGRLSKQEENRLVELARVFILHSKKTIVTPAEAEFMRTHYPEMDAAYDGYKKGLLSISWNTGKRRIVARLYGNMNENNRAWRISIYFKPQVIITPRARAKMHPVRTAGVKDFTSIFTEQGVKSKSRPQVNAKPSDKVGKVPPKRIEKAAPPSPKFVLPPGSPKVRKIEMRLTH